MSNVTDRGVIDITLEEDNKYVLIIIDTLEWKFSNRVNHGRILQDKINDYLQYIVSGQAAEAKPNYVRSYELSHSILIASIALIFSKESENS